MEKSRAEHSTAQLSRAELSIAEQSCPSALVAPNVRSKH
jgi:hypothetical protein